jgi:UDP-3-O-[3-hydroxymyristoyl] glucosamine N-acyltransferase
MIDENFYSLRAPISLSELAANIGSDLPVPGAGDDMIERPSALLTSQPGSVTFFANKRRKNQLETARATACLTTKALAPFVANTGMIALVTENPRAAFARLSHEMVRVRQNNSHASKIHKTANVHPTAIIGENVSIGAGSKIGAHCVIDDSVTIGKTCIIEPLARVSFTVMGDNCHIKSCAVIGGSGFGVVEDAQGVFNIPHLGRVIMHDAVHIGSNSCVDRGQLDDTIICKDVKIDNLVQIAHNVFIGEGTMIAGHAGISGSCVIGKNCRFGGRAGLADHITVGDGAIVAASAGVMSDIPAGEMYSGIPAMPVKEHMRTVVALKKLVKK